MKRAQRFLSKKYPRLNLSEIMDIKKHVSRAYDVAWEEGYERGMLDERKCSR